MPLKKIFWFTISLTILFLILQVIGFDAVEVLFCLTVIDIVILKIWTSAEKSEMKKQIESIIAISQNILETIQISGRTPIHMPQINIDKHKEELRAEFKENIDKLAKKSISIENDLNKTKKDFMYLFSEFNKKIKELETNKEIEIGF